MLTKFAVLHWELTYETPLERRQLCRWARSYGLCTYESEDEIIISTIALDVKDILERLGLYKQYAGQQIRSVGDH